MGSENCLTYPQNSRIIWHWRRCRFGFFRCFLDPKVLHVTASKYDVFVGCCRGRDFFFAAATAFGAERPHIFKRDCGVLGVDVDKRPDIANVALRYEGYA